MAKYRYQIGREIEAATAVIGVQPQAVLRGAGLSVHFLDDPQAAVEPAQYFAIWEAVGTLAEEADLGVALGRKMPHMPFGSSLIAFSCADTIRTGLERLALFKPLIAPIRIAHEETAAGYRVRFLPLEPALRFSPLLANFEISFFVELCRLLTGRDIAPRRVVALDPAPSLEDYLGCAIKAGDTPEIIFRHTDIHLPLISENADIWQGLEPILTRRLLGIDRSARTSERVRVELVDLLPSGRSSIEDVCKRLNKGRRNLQRLLRDEGTSYRAVLDDLRQELALSYLRDDAMRVEEISYLLAFSDPSSFYRAFRDWTGMTPAAARNPH